MTKYDLKISKIFFEKSMLKSRGLINKAVCVLKLVTNIMQKGNNITNAKKTIANNDKNSNIIFSETKSWFRYLKSYFLSLFVKNNIKKNIPVEYHNGELSFNTEQIVVNNSDNIKIFNK